MTSGSNSFISRTQSPAGGASGCMPRTKSEPRAGCVAISCWVVAVASAAVVVGAAVVVEPIEAAGNNVETPQTLALALAERLATK